VAHGDFPEVDLSVLQKFVGVPKNICDAIYIHRERERERGEEEKRSEATTNGSRIL
jgi:hypothetical protein